MILSHVVDVKLLPNSGHGCSQLGRYYWSLVSYETQRLEVVESQSFDPSYPCTHMDKLPCIEVT